MEEGGAGNFTRQQAGLWLGLALFVLFLILPAPAGMTPATMRMAAVAVLMATWWISEAAPISATALVPLVLYPLLGIMGSRKVSLAYANHLVFLFLGGFLIAIAIERVNLHLRIALQILKFVGASPRRLLLGFMVATAFLSMWISNTATTMMMLPISLAVVTEIAIQTGKAEEIHQEGMNKFGIAMMLAIAYAANIGGIGTLVGTPPNIVFAGFVKRLFPAAPEITFLKWMMVGVPLVIVFIAVAWFYLSRRVDAETKGTAGGTSVREIIEDHLRSLGPMTKGERIVLLVFVTTALLWIFRSPIPIPYLTIPGWSSLFESPKLLHDATVAMGMGLLLFFLPLDFKRREFILNWDLAHERVPWGVLLLFGGGFALAAGFQQTGLTKWIGETLGVWKGFPPIVMILGTALLMTFLTEVTSNTATTTMMMPILAATAVGLGTHPFLLMIPATLAASCAFMLPVATPPNAIVFGSKMLTIPQMARAGLAMNLVGVILVTALMYLVAFAVFGITAGVPIWAR